MSALFCPHCGQPLKVIEQTYEIQMRKIPLARRAELRERHWIVRGLVMQREIVLGTCEQPDCQLYAHTLSAETLTDPARLAEYHATLQYVPETGLPYQSF